MAKRVQQVQKHLNNQKNMSLFETTLAPEDAIFALTAGYKADTDPNRINLGVGAYRDNNGNPWVLPVVKAAEIKIANDNSLDHEYLPIDGLKSFTEASAKLILGADSPALSAKRVASAQAISGTGACRLGGDFLRTIYKNSPLYISNPTWGNHRAIFTNAGFADVREYPYWDPATKGLNLEALLQSFQDAPSKSILVLHPCAHNPTGVDPTMEQWKRIAEVVKQKDHVVFFDCAYQGFASGSLEKDAQAVRYFVEQGLEVLIAQSYSKNFGLYNERAGCLSAVCKTAEVAQKVSSQFKLLIRAGYSNPPALGARIVASVLSNPKLFEQWEVELKIMANRIIDMRKALYDNLIELKTPGSWEHITNQIGMFSFTGLNAAQVKVLKDKYHVYMTSNGRISMAGLNTENVAKFAAAVDFVVRNVQ